MQIYSWPLATWIHCFKLVALWESKSHLFSSGRLLLHTECAQYFDCFSLKEGNSLGYFEHRGLILLENELKLRLMQIKVDLKVILKIDRIPKHDLCKPNDLAKLLRSRCYTSFNALQSTLY